MYEHRATVTAASGSTSSDTLRIHHGILRQLLIRAGTDTTTFLANLTDSNGVVRLNFDQHEGELNALNVAFPMIETYTINITNTSRDDTFTVVAAISEDA